VLGGCASGGRGHGDSRNADAKSQVLQREREWVEAMRGHDYDTLDDTLAREFRLTFVERPGRSES